MNKKIVVVGIIASVMLPFVAFADPLPWPVNTGPDFVNHGDDWASAPVHYDAAWRVSMMDISKTQWWSDVYLPFIRGTWPQGHFQ